jgi:signal transduction histidine kinase
MQESCIGCHNSRPDSPKRDWRVGDLRGVLEVTLPLDRIILAVKKDLQTTTYFYVIVAVLLLLGIVILVIKQWSYSSLLEHEVQLRTSELLSEIELRKRFEERLINAKEEAESANNAKSEFLSHMSHELRTPLNAVIGFSQLLAEEELSDEQMESVLLILSSGRHLLELINDLLDLSRIEAGRLEVQRERVAVPAILSECKFLLAPMAQEKGVSLLISDECDSYCVAWGDPMRVKQVMINLISNAIKYNRDNGSVTVHCDAAKNNHLRVRVTDTGIGISEGSLQHLFQPFERLGLEMTHLEGTGIGLALSKRLIEMMDGRIGVESVEGEGSTFWVELSLAEAEDEILPFPNSSASGN